MIPLSASEIRRLLEVTDGLGLHREAVVIPLAREGAGDVQAAGGKLVLAAPAAGLEAWLAALPQLIARLDLSGIKRSDPDEG